MYKFYIFSYETCEKYEFERLYISSTQKKKPNEKKGDKKMKKTNAFKRLFSLTLALVMVLGIFTVTALAKGNKEEPKPSGVISADKIEKSYEIAVAYDNSGSMYFSNNKPVSSWYQAKYAMEIFASMMDLDNGDKLTIFPMHAVTTDSSSAQTTQIDIRSIKDIDKIHNMYTIEALGTPYDPIDNAYEHLMDSSADERWLIVLTDGSEFTDVVDRNKKSCSLHSALIGLSKDVNVQYLPLGTESIVLKPKGRFYATEKQITSENMLQKELISACNKIFQRDELEGTLKGTKLTLDLSMKKLIVFAQGNGAEIISLKNSEGTEINRLVDSGKRTYSDKGAANKSAAVLPEKLKKQTGQVVTFDACRKGTYTLDCANANDIKIFYEPDVTMEFSFINKADGIPEDFSDGSIIAGEYTYKVKIIDNQTRKDVSNHKLMGDVSINSYITYPGEDPKPIEDDSEITFTPEENISFDISATYLGKYRLSTDDDSLIDWSNIEVLSKDSDLKVKPVIEQPGDWYTISDYKKWKPIRVELSLDGEKLTDEQLKQATISIDLKDKEKSLPYITEILPGESAINIHLGKNEKGEFCEPDTGKYEMSIGATAPDEYGEIVKSGTEEASFEIQKYSKIIKIIFWLIVAAIIIFLLSIPSTPSKIYLSVGTKRPSVQGAFSSARGFNVECISTDFRGKRAFSAQVKRKNTFFRNSWVLRWTSRSMTCYLSDITPTRATKLSLLNDGSKKVEISDGDEITWREGSKTYTGIVNINHIN